MLNLNPSCPGYNHILCSGSWHALDVRDTSYIIFTTYEMNGNIVIIITFFQEDNIFGIWSSVTIVMMRENVTYLQYVQSK